ncbi:phage infection protein [Rhizobium mesoamericanum]|uniref:phage infection protein n=1 Tax=Rhizobium mesoamericanum TaxID=1079800 RepID=UPI0003FEC801|nr:phage infection protein [Rhizobium mesoamericanum]
MNKIAVKLEHCYGIKKLEATFDFTKGNAVAIYAPNGAMKSSLAKTFHDIAAGTASVDRIFANRVTSRDIKDENGNDLAAADVLVVQPYDEVLGHSAKTSTLLVNAALRKEYEDLHADIEKAKEAFLSAMKTQSGSKKDLAAEISSAFTSRSDDLMTALVRVREEMKQQKETPYAGIKYDVIFDENVLNFLGTKDFKTTIEEYVKKYNELLGNSTYFKKGTFNYYNASNIAKNLADNGFFRAKHTLRLNADASTDISDEKELEAIIKAEKDAITNDTALKKKFAEIEKLLQKNAGMRGFEAYLSENEDVLPRLSNVASFKEDVWKSYIASNYDLYEDLLVKHQSAEKRRSEIEEQASKERTQWEDVIDIFNDRFFVPFTLIAKNRTSVILGQEPMLSLGFTFEDAGESAPVERTALIAALSTGEKKALYILNILFEIEVRRASGQSTLLIVDDIADSFDYRNKYAIIQYLKDISDDSNFNQIILTHNFDFFRTLNSRFVKYSNCFMISKSSTEIQLGVASGIKNIFVNDWKPGFANDARKRTATIPFMRNLIEFTKGEADPDFIKLTSLLHWKADTSTITEGDLYQIYNNLFGTTLAPQNAAALVMDIVEQEAKACRGAVGGVNFENKIVLAIGTRVLAEKHMAAKIGDPVFLAGIAANQTAALLKRFKKDFPSERNAIKTLEKVLLMTPENIHLNSFMYEPILDMSDEHLRKLHEDVEKL